MLPWASAVMPSGCAAPGGRVANRVAGVRNHACAGGARNATTSTAIRMRLTSLMGMSSWSEGVNVRAGTVSRRRRLRAGVTEDAGHAKRGDALRRIVKAWVRDLHDHLAQAHLLVVERLAHRVHRGARHAPGESGEPLLRGAGGEARREDLQQRGLVGEPIGERGEPRI